MKTVLFFLSIFSLLPANAAEHREHSAHVHGQGSVAIAFDQGVGKIELTAPAESIVGFEHAPKNDSQKKKQAEALQKLSDRISKMIAFDASLKCEFAQDHVDIGTGEHSDVDGSWNVTCAQSPLGTKIVLSFQKHFPALKKVEVVALMGSVQKSVTASRDGTDLILK